MAITKNEINDTIYKLAIDLGSANLKIATKIDDKEYKFKKIKSSVSTNAIDKNYVVSTSSNTLYFGVGDSLIQQDKTKREYIEETILLAASLMFEDIEGVLKIDLAIGLPLDLYKSENKRAYFDSRLQNITNGSPISGNVNGKDIIVKVNSTIICAEGYSSFLSLNNKMNVTEPLVLIDSGYRTTDILAIDISNEDKELIIGDFKTFNKGMLEVFEDIQKQFLNDTGHNFSIETVENRILNSPTLTIGNDKIDIHNWVKYGAHTVKEILKLIELAIPDVASRNVYLVGGGSVLFKEIIDFLNKDGQTDIKAELVGNIDELIYANVAGYHMQL